MHRISARSAKALVDLGRSAGFDVAALLEGLPFSEDALLPNTAEVEWPDYLRLLDRLVARAGGLEGFDELLLRSGMTVVPELVDVGRLFPNARSYVRFFTTVMFPPTNPVVRASYNELADGRVRVELALHAAAEPSLAYFRLSVPMLRRLIETKLGAAPEVEADVHPNGGTYTLRFPDEPVPGVERFDDGGWLSLVGARAQPQVELDPETAAWVDRLERVLAGVGATLVHASLVEADGTERVLRAHPWPNSGIRVTGLVNAGHLVGWVRYLAPASAAAGVNAVLEALAPGLAELVGGGSTAAIPVGEPELLTQTQLGLALRASLDTMSDAAVLIGPDGTFRALNASAEAMLASPAFDDAVDRLEAAADGAHEAGVVVTPLDDRGLPGYRLAFIRGTGAEVQPRVERARDAWRLTPRQAEVLAAVARGLSNKEIGTALACAEVTVEQHVTQLFRKAGVHGRTALVARLWSLVP